ncbi:MAG: S8 family serine peptidase [Anaerolineales bacterium]|nr:S8 family serine peptidase [Anaerolineales bacterium]
MHKKGLLLVIVFLIALLVPATLMGQTDAQPAAAVPDDALPTDQILIQFVDAAAESRMLSALEDGRLSALSSAAGAELTYVRPLFDTTHVLKLAARLPYADVAAMSAQLNLLAEVAYAEPDRILRIIGSPVPAQAPVWSALGSGTIFLPAVTRFGVNDPLYVNQWHYGYTAGSSEGLNLWQAWQIKAGSPDVVVAVADTGIRNHVDLAGRTIAGYDFIGDPFVANDGGGRDNDPSDPGDWITANECGFAHPSENSSWHGTHVAGTIGASSNNNLGVTGVDWHARILPVRVLGKCGGYTSDILDGVRWAAGLSVSGVPTNPNKADVINMSLGGSGACGSTEQQVYTQVYNAGVTVVVAAGNSNANASNFTPASCNNVVTVASTDRTGDRASYSNYGSVVEVSAPGGETFPTMTNGVLSTLNSGSTTPQNDNYVYYQGTSMAAPHVAGAVSLLLSKHPALTPAQIVTRLKNTARAFPAGSSCNTSICGTGIVDAYNLLTNTSVTPPPPPPPPNCNIGESSNVSNALTITSGQMVCGSVSQSDQDDVYRIYVEQNKDITIVMTGSGGDADLYLYPPGTTDVTTDPWAAVSNSIGNDELISGTILTAGWWYVDIYSYSGSSNYEVTVTVATRNPAETSNELTAPGTGDSAARQAK